MKKFNDELETRTSRESSSYFPELSVIVPTLNEVGNIALVVAAISKSLGDCAWELVFVDDDSNDGTRDEIIKFAQNDSRIRLIHRIGRRGLSSACIEGFLATTAPFIAVTDADLQHDVRLLSDMFRTLKTESIDIAIGSRYTDGGGSSSFSKWRGFVSQTATKMAKILVRAEVTDPMSGFFMVRRDAINAAAHRLSGIGFKILLDILASSPKPLRVKEFPYKFGVRLHGESKLDSMVITEYLALLLDKTTNGIISIRFLKFALIGASGLALHIAILAALFETQLLPFLSAQIIATIVAIIYNFLLDNRFVYRDMRLKGFRLLYGMITFMIVCSVGAIANIDISNQLYLRNEGILGSWWLSGICGAIISLVWNYAVTSVITWHKKAN